MNYRLAFGVFLRAFWISPNLYTFHRAFGHVYVVVQFYPWFKLSFLLFLGMVMYGNDMIMSLKQKKRKFEPKIKLNHNNYADFKLSYFSQTRSFAGTLEYCFRKKLTKGVWWNKKKLKFLIWRRILDGRDLKMRGRRRQRKRPWKSEFAFFQSSSRLFQVTNFVKRRRTILKLNS